MLAKTLTIPEDAMVNMLKTLPEDILVEVFWKALVESDVSPLTHEEREETDKGKTEFKKEETIKLHSRKGAKTLRDKDWRTETGGGRVTS